MRKLFRLIVVAAIAYFGWKMFESKREEFMGLTESEAKAKLREKLTPRLGEETADQIVEQVVPKLREKGIVQPDPA
ncbi:MAG: hypothetical protein ACRDVL_11870 [Acidimicrobiia bacterium]